MRTFRKTVVAVAWCLLCLYLVFTPLSSETKPYYESSLPNDDLGKLSTNPSETQLYEKLSRKYLYNVDDDFPSYIWQTWKWNITDERFTFREQKASWTKLHPGFNQQIITDDLAKDLVYALYDFVPEVIDAYNRLPLPVLKADFFRYLVLLAYGGIYTDIDTFALRPAEKWIPEQIPHEAIGLVVGIEADPDRPDWRDWYSRRIQFCQWTIQSKPGHPVLRDIVVRITEKTLELNRNGKLDSITSQSVVELTGPALWTDVIFDYFNGKRYLRTQHSRGLIDWQNFTKMEIPKKVDDVVVLPITSFSPGVGHMGSKKYDDPLAFVKHGFKGTWKST